jgi:hypothetical protein
MVARRAARIIRMLTMNREAERDTATAQRGRGKRFYDPRPNDERMAAVLADIERAIAEGRHTRPGEHRTVCTVCGEWVECMYDAPHDGAPACCILCAAKRGDESAIKSLAKAAHQLEAAQEPATDFGAGLPEPNQPNEMPPMSDAQWAEQMAIDAAAADALDLPF